MKFVEIKLRFDKAKVAKVRFYGAKGKKKNKYLGC